jgi:hypothetical protein
VFCLSLGDIWDNEVPAAWRRDAFHVMEQTPNLIYLLLSKRIGNSVKMAGPYAGDGAPALPKNAALGATMVTQDEWDRDIRKLKACGKILGARFTFASVEPMLGPIDMRGELPDWVIVGGESGKDARPLYPDLPRSLRDQCAAAGVPFLFKQMGRMGARGSVRFRRPPARVASRPRRHQSYRQEARRSPARRRRTQRIPGGTALMGLTSLDVVTKPIANGIIIAVAVVAGVFAIAIALAVYI